MGVEVVHTDVTDVSKAISIIGAFVVFYGPFSLIIKERLCLSEPLLAVVYGIIVGPIVLKWVDPFSWGDEESIRYLTYQVMRMALGVQVLFCGVSLPAKYLERNWLSLFMLLLVIMTIAWFVCGLLIWGLIPGLTFVESLCLGAAITPTDPVLSNGIANYAEQVLGDILIAEGGANDGLGYPFLYLPIYLMRRRADGPDAGLSVGSEIGRWVYSVPVFQILLSALYGFVVGLVARKVLKWAERRDWVEKNNFFVYSLGLALFCLGTCGMFGSDDILACFIAGNSFSHDDWFRLRTLENDTQDVFDLVMNVIAFVYAGTIIPFHMYSEMYRLEAWRMVVLAICVLLARRLPWVVLLYRWIPALRTFKDALFCGWLGPIGVSAIYYIEVALREIPESRHRLREAYAPVVLFMVLSSVVVHGITIPMMQFVPAVRTFNQTRSLTLTQPSQTLVGIDNGGGKLAFNPIHSFYARAKTVVLFWRPDSFWRYPKTETTVYDHIQKDNIASPKDARVQPTVPERASLPTPFRSTPDVLGTDHPSKDDGFAFQPGQDKNRDQSGVHDLTAANAPQPDSDSSHPASQPLADLESEPRGGSTTNWSDQAQQQDRSSFSGVRRPPSALVLPK